MRISKLVCDQCKQERDTDNVGAWPMIEVALTAITEVPARCGPLMNRVQKHFCTEVCLRDYLNQYFPK